MRLFQDPHYRDFGCQSPLVTNPRSTLTRPRISEAYNVLELKAAAEKRLS